MSEIRTSVPQPTLGPDGFLVPSETAILQGVQQDWQNAFGGRLVFTTQSGSVTNPTPAGVLTASEAAIIGDSYAVFLWYTQQVDPAYNSGRMQDAIARIYFITRNPGLPTVVAATCTGLPGVQIPVGALAQATDGNLYVCTEAGTIPQSGSVVLSFSCSVVGPVPCPVGALDFIYQAIPGWDTIDNAADGDLGVLEETPSQFEARRKQSTGWNAMGPLGSILGAVYQVQGVLDAYVTENDTASPLTVGGVTLAPNSLYVAVLGGAAADVAAAIWSRKMPGCAYNGNTSFVVTDPSPQYTPPAPSYTVLWETPAIVDFAVLVVLKNNPGVPSNALTLVQGAIISGFAGTDGGSRARIGSTVFASRYYADVIALGAWATQIVDIQLGIAGTAAQFTASISGTTMTVTAVSGGALAVGQLVQDSSGLVATGTVISALGSGSGGTGTYSVSVSQTVTSEAMDATTLYNDVPMNIDQAPSVSAGNIGLALV